MAAKKKVKKSVPGSNKNLKGLKALMAANLPKKPGVSPAVPPTNKTKAQTMGTKTAAKSSVSKVKHAYTRSQRGLE